MNRRTKLYQTIDWLTVILWLVMMLLGWISIYAAVYNEQHHSIIDFTQRYGKQLLWIFAAIIIAAAVLLIEDSFFNYFAYGIYGFSVILLVLVLVLGKEVNGARSWFEIGSFQFQPSEFAKYGTALGLARYLSTTGVRRVKNKLFKSILFIILPFSLIALQPDFGSVLIYFAFIIVLYREGLTPVIPILGISIAALFILTLIIKSVILLIGIFVILTLIFALNNKKIKYFLIPNIFLFSVYFLLRNIFGNLEVEVSNYNLFGGIILLILLLFNIRNIRFRVPYTLFFSLIFLLSVGFTKSVDYVFYNFLEPHQQKRINVLLGLENDPRGAGYNVMQSKIAIGSGGFSGKGFLKGTQTKYKFVPEQSTDFIFCTVGEEWGFIGTATVIILFSIFLVRIINLAERQRQAFNRIYGYGVLAIFLFHFTVNIGMTIGLFPVVGIPLPFFSYGGSSLWTFTILLFTLLKLDAVRLDSFGR